MSPILIPESIRVLKLGGRTVVVEKYADHVAVKDGARAYVLNLHQYDLDQFIEALEGVRSTCEG
jgi:hypothetical protein